MFGGRALMLAIQLLVGFFLIILLWAVCVIASNRLPKTKSRQLDWFVIHPAFGLLTVGWWTFFYYPWTGMWTIFIPLLPAYVILLAIVARLLKTRILKPTTKQTTLKPKGRKPPTG